jgi:DNA polymerase I-like protein with 3'-5' exonuclease and polymerase domains
MGTEADIIKRAMGRILAEFDQHPEWGAHFANMCHDEVDIECLTAWEDQVAQCVQREFDEAMKWVIKVIPVSDGDWKSTIVGSWAAK